MILEGLYQYFRDPEKFIFVLAYIGCFDWMDDKIYLKMLFRIRMNRKLNLDNPVSFNEKIQWLKLYDHNTEYINMVDKYQVKEIVREKLGEQFVIPVLGVWNRVEEIDFEILPDQFVLKCTHDSGSIVICNDRQRFDRIQAKKKLRKYLKQDFSRLGREWPYKDVKPLIIAEKFMGDNLRDYKIFCFHGLPKLILVSSDRFSLKGLKEDYYDEEWNHLNMKRPGRDNVSEEIPRPKNFELMKELAGKLAKNIPFVRIDFYEIKERLYFGEITFFPAGGFLKFVPEEWDLELGNWIHLDSVKMNGRVEGL